MVGSVISWEKVGKQIKWNVSNRRQLVGPTKCHVTGRRWGEVVKCGGLMKAVVRVGVWCVTVEEQNRWVEEVVGSYKNKVR